MLVTKKRLFFGDPALVIGGVYLLFFLLYQIGAYFSHIAWGTTTTLTYNTKFASNCTLQIHYPAYIVPENTLSRQTSSLVLKTWCNSPVELPPVTVTFWAPDDILFWDTNEIAPATITLLPGNSPSSAIPREIQISYRPSPGLFYLITNTQLRITARINEEKQSINLFRQAGLLSFFSALGSIVFNQTMFGILGGGIVVYKFWNERQKDIKQRQQQQLKDRIQNLLTQPVASQLLELNSLLSQGAQELLMPLITAIQKDFTWKQILGQRFFDEYCKQSGTWKQTIEVLADAEVQKSLRYLCQLDRQRENSWEQIISALYFLGIPNINILLQKQKFQSQEQDKDTYKYSLIRYILLRQADTETQKRAIRKNFNPSLPDELDFWRDEAPAYSPTATPHPFQPLKAEADPVLRSHGLFWEAWPVWKVINADAQAHWFTGAGGSGISASLRMGQYHHRPWGIHRFGFSLYVRWQGEFSATRWETALQAALYRSLQRALAEDPVWFLQAPQATRLIIQHFMDSQSLRQDGWQPPAPDAASDAQAKDAQLLREAFAYLRALSGKDDPSPPLYEVLQQSFAALYAYHRDSVSHHDEKPWVWIELPPDAAPDSRCQEEKIRFLKANEDLWSYCTPKIFLPFLPDDVHLPESISLQWDEKQLAALLEHRMRQSNWVYNWDFWETILYDKLVQVNDPLDLQNILPWQDGVDKTITAFCQHAARGCQTPQAMFERLSPYASLFQKSIPEG